MSRLITVPLWLLWLVEAISAVMGFAIARHLDSYWLRQAVACWTS